MKLKKNSLRRLRNYKRFSGEGKAEEAKAALEKCGDFSELEDAQALDRAERGLLADKFSEQERSEINRFFFPKFIREAAEGSWRVLNWRWHRKEERKPANWAGRLRSLFLIRYCR